MQIVMISANDFEATHARINQLRKALDNLTEFLTNSVVVTPGPPDRSNEESTVAMPSRGHYRDEPAARDFN